MKCTGSGEIHRRAFLAAAGAAASAFTIVPARALGRSGAVAANSRINVGFIGVGSQGLRVMFDFLAYPDVQAVAVADPVRSASNYHQWSKDEFSNRVNKLVGVNSGWEWLSPNSPMLPLTPTFSTPAGVAGREPARRIIDGYNGRRSRTGESRGCAAYADFREMLDKEADIDAVVIGTTDVLHAPASIASMMRGKHVFCQKPMSHSLSAARRMAEVAKSSGVATQVALPKQASEETRRLCEWISAGVIGPIGRVVNWTNRPSWPQGLARPTEVHPEPDWIDWDLWLGPAPWRPYHPAYLPFVWRGWSDFGCGAFGDMGCYSLDSIYRALKLTPPIAAEASSSERFPETFSKASTIHLDFPPRDGLPPVRLTWFDGGLKPERPEGLETDRQLPSEGTIFHGTKGFLLCDFNGGSMELYPKSLRTEFVEPPRNLPRSPGTEREWLDAVKDTQAPRPGANFEFSAKVTEALHLGNLAARTGEQLGWDSATSKLDGSEVARSMARPEYREGWGV
ncbi:Gfo/Idh/MocA family protein [Tundrisphaera lichenicola]|uniref:Gfo/Idh/MocA family protein n=1 Tax=Tundrisphaera lichenicola TaxID=2029860 RepID=UPI003EBF73F9